MSKLVAKYSPEGDLTTAYIAGGPAVISTGKGSDKPVIAGNVAPNKDETSIATQKWVDWGSSNDFPDKLIREVRKNGAASSALDLKRRMLYGQRIMPVRVTEFDPNTGKETLELVQDEEITSFLSRSNINMVRSIMLQDYTHLSIVFPMFLLTEDHKKISSIAIDKARKFRFAPFKGGRIPSVFRSANWPNPSDDETEEIEHLDVMNWFYEVDRVRLMTNKKKFVMSLKAPDVLNDYYPVSVWDGIRSNGWLDNSNSVPLLIKSMIKNVMHIKYHIRIPSSYWRGMYTKWDSMDQKGKDQIVGDKLTEMNDFLTGKENAMKAFISHYATDPQSGKEAAGWQIDALDDKMKYDAWNGVNSQALQEIFFAIGVNPALFGLSSPGGGHAGGSNNGGSNIRESWLIMVAGAQVDRDIVYGWWDFVKAYNGWDSSIELRTMDKVLTTLDTGKGTEKTLS